MNRIKQLNERYGPTNMTGFKIVCRGTDKATLFKHFEEDLLILMTSDVKLKRVVRVILEGDVIDICSYDNGTPVSYFFTPDADFRPKDVAGDIRQICERFEIAYEEIS